MRSFRAAIVIMCTGLLTFGFVFGLLQLSRSDASPDLAGATPTPTALPVGPASDSLAYGMVAGQVAVGVPSTGSEPLLLGALPGDRLDVLASLPSPIDGRPVTVVVVSGATVMRPATGADPLLVEVSAADAIVLAHVVLGGTHLAYAIWPDGVNPSNQQPLDERTARALLNLPALADTTPAPAVLVAALPTLAPIAVPAPEMYTVKAGESLYAVAERLGVNPGALWWANRSVVDPTLPLAGGTSLQVPLAAGFLYQVQPGDTWDSVAAIFGMPASDLWQRNQLQEGSALVSGMLLFIPRQS